MSRLFAISDIHGCFKPFYKLVTYVINLTKDDRLMLLGDYIDRGEQSKEVIDFIIDLKTKGFNITTLIGNHESMLIDSYYNQDDLPLWLMNSGSSTLKSFDIQDIRDIDEKYIEFFGSLEYFKIIGKTIFVHAGFDDTALNPFSDKQSMIWTSRYSYQNPRLSGMTIIHGHRPNTLYSLKKNINEKSNVISIDTGCVYDSEQGYGMLTALEVNSMSLSSVPNF